jgi:transketolase
MVNPQSRFSLFLEEASRAAPQPLDPAALEEKLLARLRALESRGISWHMHSSLSLAPILAALYGSWLPKGLSRGVRRAVIVSKGHGSLALYALMELLGLVPQGSVERLFTAPGSPFQAHPEAGKTPLTLVSTGSLGQGLSVGLGLVLAGRIRKEPVEVAVVLGDGELDEGQVWEAALSASAERARGLIAVVDRNMEQHTGPTEEVKPKEPLAEKWRSFGWRVVEVEARAREVAEALEGASQAPGPVAVIVRRV